MINIFKKKLSSATLYSVMMDNGIPVFKKNENCRISFKKGNEFKYRFEIINGKNEILYIMECDRKENFNEIKIDFLFYDEKEALEEYKKETIEIKQKLKEEIKIREEKLKLFEKCGKC